MASEAVADIKKMDRAGGLKPELHRFSTYCKMKLPDLTKLLPDNISPDIFGDKKSLANIAFILENYKMAFKEHGVDCILKPPDDQ